MKKLLALVILLSVVRLHAAIPGTGAFDTNNFNWTGVKMLLQQLQSLGYLRLTNGGLKVTTPPGQSNFVLLSQATISGMLIDPRNYGVTNWDGVHDDYP